MVRKTSLTSEMGWLHRHLGASRSSGKGSEVEPELKADQGLQSGY